jgi:hypothetical protein
MRKVMLLLLAVIIICPVLIACNNSGSVVEPTVGNIPDGWYLSAQETYGTYVEADGTKWAVIEYTDEVDSDFVQIYYGDVPQELKGNETDGDTLIERAIQESVTFEPTETGTMNIGNHLAGYARAYNASYDYYEMEIVLVIGSTCIDIYALFDATAADEAQAMSLINSIR